MKLRSVLAVAILCGLAACDSTSTTSTAAPGAVGSACCKGKPAGDPSCCLTQGKACDPAKCADPAQCTDKKAAGTCPITGQVKSDTAAPGAVAGTTDCSSKADCSAKKASGCCSKKANTDG